MRCSALLRSTLAASALLASPSGRLASVASAQEQSPIDIRAQDLVQVGHSRTFPYPVFAYGSLVRLDVINTGSPDEDATIRALVPSGAGRLWLGTTSYELLQFHWHTPSEHTIDGEEFPMEMHLVHQASDGSLVVVGVLIRAGKRHAELDKIFSRLPDEAGKTATVKANLNRLLPPDFKSYRYRGSLTTPPFTEGVQWIVLAEPIEMSAEQIFAFMELFPEGDSREVQPLNGRVVTTDFDPFAPIRRLFAQIVNTLGGLTLL